LESKFDHGVTMNAVAVFKRLGEAYQATDRLLNLCVCGLGGLSKSADLVEALANYEAGQEPESDPAERSKTVENAKRMAEWAQEEIDRDFPQLHGQSLVTLWGLLETAIVDYVVARVLAEPKLLRGAVFERVKVPVASYEELNREDFVRTVLDQAEMGERIRYKGGIGRFEGLLGLVELSGVVEDDVCRTLFEFQQVRNVLVHRAGIVDRRFEMACPGFGAKAGDRIRIGRHEYERYVKALDEYAATIVNRHAERMRPGKKGEGNDA
jgi:hypothetical protein